MALPIKKPGVSWTWLMLLAGLSLLAWISTYTGIMELIIASSGNIGTPAMAAVGFAVAMLQLMILYLLDSMFSGKLRWFLWPFYIVGYILLFIISVGFAFGFYWKYLEAGSVTTQAAESSIIQVQQSLQTGASRLEQLQTTFTTLGKISSEKAELERTQGGTCPRSSAGDGPRRRLREGDAQRFSFANQFIGTRVDTVKADFANLNVDLEKIISKDPSTIGPGGSRKAYIGEVNRKLGLVATRFNALRTDPQLMQLRDELNTRASQSTFSDDRGGTFICPDPQLRTALDGVVRAINELPELHKPELRSYEGSEAVIEAFRRLTTSGIGWMHQLSAAITGKPAPLTAGGLTDRDMISLIIAIFVDICILLVSINRPFGRLFQLSEALTQARQGSESDFLATFYSVFQNEFDPKKAPTPVDVLSPIHDVVFDHNGRYYAAVPLDFRERHYWNALRERKIADNGESGPAYDPFHPSSFRPLETSRYISSVFSVLEGNGIVKLLKDQKGGTTYEDGITRDLVHDKLNRQGSIYAQADAYRVYRFGGKMYADLILRTVASTAAKEKERQKKGMRETPLRSEQRELEFEGEHPSYYRGVLPSSPSRPEQDLIANGKTPKLEHKKSGTAEEQPNDVPFDEAPADDINQDVHEQEAFTAVAPKRPPEKKGE